MPWALPLPTAPPPTHVEVVVIGAGIAGLTATAALAARGVRVALVESEPALGRGASWRDPGLLTPGLPEPAWRLESAIGAERAAALYAMADPALALLASLGIPTTPAWHLAVDAREPDELDRSAAALVRFGLRPERLDGEAAARAAGGEGWTGALRVDADRAFSTRALATALLGRALGAGAAIHGDARADRIEDGADGLVVRLSRGAIRAHAALLTAGPGLRGLDPRFADTITPVREHALRLAAGGPTVGAGRGQLGYVAWRPDDDGSLVVSGCRWATEHLEVGETDDRAASPRVIAKVHAFARRHLGAGDRPATASWARIVAHTCDGLPIVGPMPGDPTRVACAGFQGWSPALAIAAAQGAVRGLLDGASELPPWLSPSRFV